ncbi:ribosome-binding factor A [Arcanobacterium pluranimalium]|uniref:30S ribosome-binding factor RbfA n=1 Tax=Arcanobacterium pluranimalium TaxID=108028 RepID=UPI0019571B5F|nr:30S ribosome-binding factor RbfA [Arcanobacterium pluranimalium]MBM7825640.1 ribosome-binding factor A [Arcanobacterium pluranimalium]
MANPRAARVADQIKQIVARMIDGKLKDPRLGMVTITDVRVSGDLQHATVFYTVYGSDTDRRKSASALESAKGMIRSTVGGQLGLRLTPSIEFVLDALPETARSIEDALVAAKFHDEQVRKLAEGATPVAGEDPYRKPKEIDEDDAAVVASDSEDDDEL